MSDSHRNYLHDFGAELRDMALDAKRRAEAAVGTDEATYEQGRASAYYEVLSLMETQAKTFALPSEDLHFEGFSADRDLLGRS